MASSKKIVPLFGNYVWDFDTKRLFSGFIQNRESFQNREGLFLLKRNGKRYLKSSDELDAMCGLVDHNKYKKMEAAALDRARKRKLAKKY